MTRSTLFAATLALFATVSVTFAAYPGRHIRQDPLRQRLADSFRLHGPRLHPCQPWLRQPVPRHRPRPRQPKLLLVRQRRARQADRRQPTQRAVRQHQHHRQTRRQRPLPQHHHRLRRHHSALHRARGQFLARDPFRSPGSPAPSPPRPAPAPTTFSLANSSCCQGAHRLRRHPHRRLRRRPPRPDRLRLHRSYGQPHQPTPAPPNRLRCYPPQSSPHRPLQPRRGPPAQVRSMSISPSPMQGTLNHHHAGPAPSTVGPALRASTGLGSITINGSAAVSELRDQNSSNT